MTYKEVIASADSLRPNMIDDAIKAKYLNDLDCDFAELMKTDAPSNNWPDDQDLLMPAPKDNCYIFYLCAMIDFINQDTALYQNDAAMSQQAIADARTWWWRNNGPY